MSVEAELFLCTVRRPSHSVAEERDIQGRSSGSIQRVWLTFDLQQRRPPFDMFVLHVQSEGGAPPLLTFSSVGRRRWPTWLVFNALCAEISSCGRERAKLRRYLVRIVPGTVKH